MPAIRQSNSRMLSESREGEFSSRPSTSAQTIRDFHDNFEIDNRPMNTDGSIGSNDDFESFGHDEFSGRWIEGN